MAVTKTIQALLAALALAGAASAAEPAAEPVQPPASEAAAKEVAEKAGDEAPATGPKGEKLLDGMSVVGNDEAPKSLVIVPWKASELGDTLDVLKSLDDGRGPVDRDVFMRQLAYYEIRVGSQEGRAPEAK